MRSRRNTSIGTIGKTVLVFVLVWSLCLAGAGTAFADPEEPYWTAPSDSVTVDPDLLTTYGVRAGSAGPDFLGISNTNFDFTAGSATSYTRYQVPAGDLSTVVGAGLAIWSTPVNENPNPYYQNLYYNTINPGSNATQATTWMTNPIGSWGDSNGTPIINYYTGASTIAGLEYSPDIIFGANKVSIWQNAASDGSNSQTIINLYFANNLGTNYGPTWTSNDATNIWTQIYTLGQLAGVADGLKTGSELTRYDSNNATTSAINYEKAIRGNLLYVASKLSAGTVDRKTVAYLYSIDSAGTGYFFVPTAANMLVGNDTGAAAGNDVSNPDPNYAANNATIDMGYMATLPFITGTYDSGTPVAGGIIMQVEDIFKTSPACTVASDAQGALAGVDVLFYNTTTLRGNALIGVQGGRNNSGITIDPNYDADLVDAWASALGFGGTLIAGDDFFTSPNQGFGVVETTSAGMSPLLYCQRNYTADKNARAAWAFAQVYPELYDYNPDATYAYWVDKIYHINLADVPTVATYMTNKSTPVVYDSSAVTFLETAFASGLTWWNTSGSTDPNWSGYAYYNGSTRASYYSTAANEEVTDIIGIFAPSGLWSADSGPARYAYSVGCDFEGASWWNTWVQRRKDLSGDLTPSILYAADTYGALSYISYYNLKPTVGFLRGKNPVGVDRLGSDIVYLDGHANHISLLCGDYEYACLFGNVPTGSEYMCGVWCYSDGQSSTSFVNYAGLLDRDLSGTRLISFVGCNTAGYLDGDGYGNNHFDDNLCVIALDCGAQATLGFTGSIDGLTPAGLYWKKKYNDGLAFGYTVQGAVNYANDCATTYAETHDEDPVNLVLYATALGDTTVTIVPA